MAEIKILTEEEIEAKVEFLSSHRCNHTPHKYIDMTGDLIAGTLLSQIMYWFADGKNRVSIYKDGNYWIAKRREDWMSEIRITQKQYDCAIKKLTGEIEPTEEEKKQKWNKGKRREKKYDMQNRLVEVKTYHFYGVPTTHIRPIPENINRKIDEWKKALEEEIRNKNNHACNPNLPNGNLVNSPNGDMEINETENCYNIYNNINNTDTKITNKDYDSNSKANSFFTKKVRENKNKSKIDQGELEERISDVVYDLRRDVFSDDQADNVESFMLYFIDRYAEVFGKKHPLLGEEALWNIGADITEHLYVEHENMDFNTCFDPLVSDEPGETYYEEIVDMYFETEFKQKIDYSMAHFSQKNVLVKLMGKATEKTWYRNV